MPDALVSLLANDCLREGGLPLIEVHLDVFRRVSQSEAEDASPAEQRQAIVHVLSWSGPYFVGNPGGSLE
jgi:hypothetical protein